MHELIRDTAYAQCEKSCRRPEGRFVCGFLQSDGAVHDDDPGVIAFHLYGDGLSSIDQAYRKLISDFLPAYLGGFFLAVLLGAVFSSFNSLLNSAATLFCLDVYAPMKKTPPDDRQMVSVAKFASVVIALFSFVVAPLLQYAPDGQWQIIRIFTGFYNIPVVVIVTVGLFTKRVPALGAKARPFSSLTTRQYSDHAHRL